MHTCSQNSADLDLVFSRAIELVLKTQRVSATSSVRITLGHLLLRLHLLTLLGTYFVLRPLPSGAKLGDGALPDLKNNRLLALPKKVLPKSHADRFMAFVEKEPTTIQDLKDNFFKGGNYETKTMGTRHTESVTIVGEGVYTLLRKEDRSTHLAYALTIPSNIGEVQEDLGLRSQGSFIISVKNPERSGPASASLPQKPEFPKE